jgi:LacI family transcriptional regulator
MDIRGPRLSTSLQMPPRSTPVTLQEIAEASGYGRSTVSLALRNHPSLRKSTGDEIRRVAQELGYVPNPLVAALMSQVRDKRRKRRERIALISRFNQAMNRRNFRDTFYPLLYCAVVEQAEIKGYGIDEFYLGRDPLSDSRLSGILNARGIHGVLFFPGNDTSTIEYPALDWSAFATVLIGFNTAREGLHQVVSDYAYDIDCALRHIREAGLRRIGFAIPDHVERATNNNWASRFLYYQHSLRPRERLPLLLSANDVEHRTNVVPWFLKHRPEVILIAGDGVRSNLKDAGVRIPEDVRLINLVQRGESGLAGIDPHTPELGHAAIELLISLLQTNQRGLPDFPRTIAIKGHWMPGDSFPNLAAPDENTRIYS